MLTGDLRNKVDQVWNAFWSGGIANPIEVIEQITYLLFLRALDSDQTREDNKALRLKTQPVHLIPTGQDAQGRAHDAMRWSRFKNMAPADMFDVLSNQVFPFLRGLQTSGGPAAETAFARHMQGARFTIPTPGLLAKVPEGRVVIVHVPPRLPGTAWEIDGRYFKRAGDDLAALSGQELRDMFAETGPDFSAQPCPGATLADLERESIALFRERWARKRSDPRRRELSDLQTLRDAELLVEGDQVSYAALILFGTRAGLTRWLAQAVLTAA